MIECISRHLSVANHHVVAPAGLGIHAHFAQHEHHHINISVESEAHCLVLGNVGEHDIAHVGIHATSPTLTPICLDAALTAEWDVDFVFYQLVAPENDTWLYLPHKKAVLLIYVVSHVFLHGEVERQASCLFLRKCDKLHIFLSIWSVLLKF